MVKQKRRVGNLEGWKQQRMRFPPETQNSQTESDQNPEGWFRARFTAENSTVGRLLLEGERGVGGMAGHSELESPHTPSGVVAALGDSVHVSSDTREWRQSVFCALCRQCSCTHSRCGSAARS